jgi:hypothetical protein
MCVLCWDFGSKFLSIVREIRFKREAMEGNTHPIKIQNQTRLYAFALNMNEKKKRLVVAFAKICSDPRYVFTE